MENTQQHEQFVMKQYSSFEIKKHHFFLLTSETPEEVFTAGFLELSTTWFSEKVKWNDALQLSMRIAGERVLTKIVGINYKSF